MSIFSNFGPNKILTFDDRNPLWMTEYIKSKIHWKNCIYNQYMNSSRNHADDDILQQAISEVSELVDDYYPAGNCMFKVNNRNTRTRCEICSKLTIKTPERR